MFKGFRVAIGLTVALATAAAAQSTTPATIQARLAEAVDQIVAAKELRQRAETLPEPEREPLTVEADQRLMDAVVIYEEVIADAAASSLSQERQAEVARVALYNLTCAHALRGEVDQALDAFERAVEAGYDDFDLIASDPDLAPLRDQSRFQNVVERELGARDQAEELVFRPMFSNGAMFSYDFDVVTLDGEPLRLRDLRGKVVIVDYWGTWCPPCRAEIPHFVELQNQFPDNLVIVGLAWEQGRTDDPTAAQVRGFAQQHGINYPLALVDTPALRDVPNLEGFPTTLFLDRDGQVRARLVGARPLAELRAYAQDLMAQPWTNPDNDSDDPF